MRIYSWNVNGIRAVIKKGEFQKFIAKYNPDVLCLQETKAKQGQAVIDLPEYSEYWHSADKPGYSGTAIFSKVKPLAVINGFSPELIKKYDMADNYGDPNKEGRVITAEFEKFYLVTVYTPNAKDDLSRLDLRAKHWDMAFLEYLKGLESGAISLDAMPGDNEARSEAYAKYGERAPKEATPQSAKSADGADGSAVSEASAANSPGKPVVFCGDLNVAHTEDDLARPKENDGKKGFTKEERAGFDNFLDAGFIDTFRLFNKDNGHYTWWTHWANARARNVGWRIDYFLASGKLAKNIKSAQIHADVMGSDHCPVSVELTI